MLTHTGTQTIETERLILRRFAYSDDDAMLKYWVADEKIQSLYSEPTYETKEAVKGLLDKYIGSYERNDYYRWAVVEKMAGECKDETRKKELLRMAETCRRVPEFPARTFYEAI